MKDLIINCEICDIRKLNPENYRQYGKISVNAELVLLNDRGKAALGELDISFNAEEFLEPDDDTDIEIASVTGRYSISGNTRADSNTVLTVNGSVYIAPDAKGALQSFLKITVNGSILCAKSLAPFLSHVSANGSISFYPDDYTVLPGTFEIDKYFPLTAADGGKYFIQNTAKIKDSSIDLSLLAKKQVRFRAKKLILPEEKIEEAVPLFDSGTQFTVIPKGFSCADSSVKLDESLIEQYGRKIFVNGNLDARGDISSIVSKIDEMIVNGKVTVTKKTKADFDSISAKYNKYEISKSVVICDKPAITLNDQLLKLSCDGVRIENCAHLTIAEEVRAQDILDLAELCNIAMVSCTEEQQAAVISIGENIAKISTDPSDKQAIAIESNPVSAASTALNAKLINTEKFIM